MKPNAILDTPVNIQNEIPDLSKAKDKLGWRDQHNVKKNISTAAKGAIINV